MVSLERLVTLVCEKNPDSFLAVAEIEEVFLFSKLHFIRLLGVTPGVIASASDFGYNFFKTVFCFASENRELRGFVIGLGFNAVAVVGIDYNNGHIKHILVENRGKHAFGTVA